MDKHYIFFAKSNINKGRMHVFTISFINNIYYAIEFYSKKNIIELHQQITKERFEELKNLYEYKEFNKKNIKFKKSFLAWVNCIGLTKMYFGINNKRIINEYDLYDYVFYNKIPNLYQYFKTIIKELIWVFLQH
jgi:hypothetical protein